ncbi:hypothetical protein ACLOJK_024220 [Asimina triloba]
MSMSMSKEEKSQALLWKFIYGFADSLVLRTAVQLCIPDIVHANGGCITLSDLASKLTLDSHRLHRLMRFLVRLEIFSEHDDVVVSGSVEQVLYRLKPDAGSLLLRDTEKSMVPIILGMTEPDFLLPWHYIKDGLGEEGKTAFEKAMGMTFWEYFDADPEKSQMFNEGMAGETRLLTESLITACVDIFQGIESVVDVGGGNGTTIKAISKAFPHLKCTVFDLPRVIAESPYIPDVERIAGDMFESVPNAEAILLKLILHDWTDDDCLKILKKCKDAVPRDGGKVIIVDVVLDEESNHELSKPRMVLDEESNHELSKPRMVLDIDMLVNTSGRERTAEDWKNLIRRAGYQGCNIRHMSSIQSVIEAFPH